MAASLEAGDEADRGFSVVVVVVVCTVVVVVGRGVV